MSATDKYTPPGLLRPRDNPDMRMMLCKAGHVDHGKTRLVKLLTGCSTDRLKAEQERGLTIELGFAPCMLGEDLGVGIVDVQVGGRRGRRRIEAVDPRQVEPDLAPVDEGVVGAAVVGGDLEPELAVVLHGPHDVDHREHRSHGPELVAAHPTSVDDIGL